MIVLYLVIAILVICFLLFVKKYTSILSDLAKRNGKPTDAAAHSATANGDTQTQQNPQPTNQSIQSTVQPTVIQNVRAPAYGQYNTTPMNNRQESVYDTQADERVQYQQNTQNRNIEYPRNVMNPSQGAYHLEQTTGRHPQATAPRYAAPNMPEARHEVQGRYPQQQTQAVNPQRQFGIHDDRRSAPVPSQSQQPMNERRPAGGRVPSKDERNPLADGEYSGQRISPHPRPNVETTRSTAVLSDVSPEISSERKSNHISKVPLGDTKPTPTSLYPSASAIEGYQRPTPSAPVLEKSRENNPGQLTSPPTALAVSPYYDSTNILKWRHLSRDMEDYISIFQILPNLATHEEMSRQTVNNWSTKNADNLLLHISYLLTHYKTDVHDLFELLNNTFANMGESISVLYGNHVLLETIILCALFTDLIYSKEKREQYPFLINAISNYKLNVNFKPPVQIYVFRRIMKFLSACIRDERFEIQGIPLQNLNSFETAFSTQYILPFLDICYNLTEISDLKRAIDTIIRNCYNIRLGYTSAGHITMNYNKLYKKILRRFPYNVVPGEQVTYPGGVTNEVAYIAFNTYDLHIARRTPSLQPYTARNPKTKSNRIACGLLIRDKVHLPKIDQRQRVALKYDMSDSMSSIMCICREFQIGIDLLQSVSAIATPQGILVSISASFVKGIVQLYQCTVGSEEFNVEVLEPKGLQVQRKVTEEDSTKILYYVNTKNSMKTVRYHLVSKQHTPPTSFMQEKPDEYIYNSLRIWMNTKAIVIFDQVVQKLVAVSSEPTDSININTEYLQSLQFNGVDILQNRIKFTQQLPANKVTTYGI